jgi:hypothetical protein
MMTRLIEIIESCVTVDQLEACRAWLWRIRNIVGEDNYMSLHNFLNIKINREL